MGIGEKLKQARVATNLTQEMIAEKTGVSRQTISNWENGKSYPDIINVIALSNVYGITMDSLLKGDSAMIKHLKESTDVTKSNRQRVASLVAFAIFLFGNVLMMVMTAGSITYYLHMPSFLVMFIPHLAVLIFTRSVKMFFTGLRAAVFPKNEITEELSMQAASLFRLLSKTTMLAAIISVILGIIGIPDFTGDADSATMLLAYIQVILISPLYCLFMIVFLFEPIVFILKKKANIVH